MVAVTGSLQVRREKISERMKLLQDLVPGCSKVSKHRRPLLKIRLKTHAYFNFQRLLDLVKVTGKAVMLDEIINYVQSLQCQVEVRAYDLHSALSALLRT
jgi:hypothetical protein